MLADHATPAIPMGEVLAYELEIYGSHGMQAWRYDAMLAMMEAGTLKPERLIGREISLDDAVPALVGMDGATDLGISVITRF